MKIRLLIAALLIAAPAWGQSVWPAGKVQFSDTDTLEAERDRHRVFAFASLPTCDSAATGNVFIVNNATNNATCDADGSADAECLCDGTSYVALSGGGGSGAPTTADYLVGTAQAGLSAEIVVGATPGGALGGTWATPTIDDN